MKLISGDSKVVLKDFQDNCFDSVVTDAPYGLESIVKRFGKEGSTPAKEGSDGRFSRSSVGFLGQTWDGTGVQRDPEFWREVLRVVKPGAYLACFAGSRTYQQIAGAIEESGFEIRDMIVWIQSQGFPKSHDLGNGIGTALAPALEPICLARKPIAEKTNKKNIEIYGTGGLNVEASRIPIPDGEIVPINKLETWSGFGQELRPEYEQEINTKGRWPKNVILESEDILGDKSRFFYCPKPNKREKQVIIDGELVSHPTTKPIELMKYLVTLVTPENGIVLDPFMGSGTTGVACKELGFDFIGIEGCKLYFDMATIRIKE